MLGPEDYVRRWGWHIFPTHGFVNGKCTCGKSHASDNQAGKHPIPRNGVKEATTDIATIQSWARAYPNCNWAVACGRISNLLVVDIDQTKSGFTSISEYEDNRPDGPLPDTLKAMSGGGGRHLFWSYPTDGVPVSNKVNWLQGVDIRSDGGYIILPYGTHRSGGRYTWINDESVSEPSQPPADLVASIRTSLTGSSTRDYSIDAASILDGVPEGRRDHTLFLAACRLRRQLGDGQRKAVEIIITTAAANCNPPFPEQDALRKVDQAWKMDHSDEDVSWGFVNSEGEAFHHLTDVGNKERFIEKFGEGFLYINGMGWAKWTDIGWVLIGEHEVKHVAEGVATVVRDEIPRIDDNRKMREWVKHALRCESAGAVNAMVDLAHNDPRIVRRPTIFDVENDKLSCLNGIVDLRTGDITPFERNSMTLKNTNVVYDPSYSLPQWEAFLKEATGGDDELITYLQMAAGYTLTGLTVEECFFVLSGPTASGKSTFVDALLAMTGGYGLTTQSETFMYRKNQQTQKNELARLVGMRLVAMSEVREGEVFDEAVVKQFTGGDRISARFLYQDTFEYTPQMKLWIATNHDPAAREKAMMRRIKRIMFPYTVPPEKRDSRLKTMLKDPDVGGRAVLSWAVKGAVKYFAVGKLLEPDQIKMAVLDYEQENDTFGQFLSETIVLEPNSTVSAQMLYDMYVMWCTSTKEYAVRRPQFVKRLKDYGYTVFKDGRQEWVRGVTVVSSTTSRIGW